MDFKKSRKSQKVNYEKRKSLFAQKKLDDKQIYNFQLKRIKDKDLNSLNLNTVAIFHQMNSGYALTPQIVKNQNVTPKEYALISENLSSFPGVDTTTDWERNYAAGNTLKTILGNVTSSSREYQRNSLINILPKGTAEMTALEKAILRCSTKMFFRDKKQR